LLVIAVVLAVMAEDLVEAIWEDLAEVSTAEKNQEKFDIIVGFNFMSFDEVYIYFHQKILIN
jgi:hypothetical protein